MPGWLRGAGSWLADRLPEALRKRPWNAAANSASIIGLLVVLATLANEEGSVALILVAYIIALSLFLILRYLRQERWARYAEGAAVMERAHERLKETVDHLLFDDKMEGERKSERFFEGMQTALSAFAEAYTLVTGSNCRASLKELYLVTDTQAARQAGGQSEEVQVALVATLSRSNLDEAKTAREEPPEPLVGNSDFEEAYAAATAFFSNDLPRAWKAGNYRNSHWKSDLRTSRNFPYRSSIVWPIEVDPGFANRHSEDRVIAFLAVDSKRTNAFRRTADVAFGGAFAHALYPALRSLRPIRGVPTL